MNSDTHPGPLLVLILLSVQNTPMLYRALDSPVNK